MLAVLALLFVPRLMLSQTVATGSVAGFLTDSKGAAVAGADVEFSNQATGAKFHVTSSSQGLYSSGPTQPADYAVRVNAKGFGVVHLAVVVRVGRTTTANVTLQVGPERPGQAGTAVNIEQPSVQRVIDPRLVETLPINGRNIFDLAQFEPNVQIQDGGVLDPAKNGIAAISLLSHYGRQTQIMVDGVDISDVTVGAPTQNIPPSAILEFQVSQSLLDLSTGPTSSGAVNIITRSGGDEVHGGVFGVYRGDQGAAKLPGTPTGSMQREQYGGDAGGPIIKDRVFWFADAERSQQNLTTAEPFVYPFDGLGISLPEPYRDFNTDERIDWNMRRSTRAFLRVNFFQNSDLRPFSSFSSAQDLHSDNNVLTGALGVDFNAGAYVHSLRFEYLNQRSSVNDATSALTGIANPIPGLGLNIGAGTDGNCELSQGGAYCGGPGWLGPQRDIQSDYAGRYDGTRVLGSHIIRFGAAYTRLEAARLAAFSEFPQVGTITLANAASTDPTSYPADFVSLGNAIGSYTAKSLFGLPGAGLGPDNRLEAYVGDVWKLTDKFTLTYGMHYLRDTGLTDSNLGGLPVLNQWNPGYGGQVRNPNINFAPQLGFAWDAGGNGKTVIRGGAGLYYAGSLWSNVLGDGPARLAKGIFADAPQVCAAGLAEPFVWPSSVVPGSSIAGGAATAVSATTVQPNFCGGTISTVAPQILALSNAFQSAASSLGTSQPNANFVGTALTALSPSYALLYPGYRTPRSVQMNLGIEQELRPGTTISVDYVRNIGLHYLLGGDINHSGAARSFNEANALAARDAAQVANGCPAGFDEVTCMINNLGQAGAQRAYSVAGLDSNVAVTGGGPCSYCAFPGTNPLTGNVGAVGGVDMLFPDGRSVYTGYHIKLSQRLNQTLGVVKQANFQASYTYSKFISQVQDQDFVNLAVDNDDPTRFTGPDAMDRRQQITFGGTFDLPFHFTFSLVSHFFSPLPQNLLLPELTSGGEIFATDWLGSGLNPAAAPEPLPGTNIGEFQRGANIYGLQRVINTYNHTYGGLLTPAGACLVANGVSSADRFRCPGLISGTPVMTEDEMVALGWVMPVVSNVAPEAAGIPWLKTMDLRAAWPIKIKDRFTVEPSATLYNVLNSWSAFQPGNLPGASLVPGPNGLLAPNAVGGVSAGSSSLTPFRSTFQSGTYAQGTPRQLEFGLHISF